MSSDNIFRKHRFILNDLLGREANVRILRYLSEASEPVGISDTAKVVGLTVSGVSRAIDSLVETGYIEQTGSGRQRQYSYRQDEDLLKDLSALFVTERIRYEKLGRALRDKIQQLSVPPISAWIEHRQDDDGKVIHLGFKSSSKDVLVRAAELRKNLYDVERRFNTTIEIHAYTKAEMNHVDASNTSLLFGIALTEPEVFSVTAGSHRDMDDRSRRRAIQVAKYVREDATILSRAKAHIEKLLREDQGAAEQDLTEWKDILESYSKLRLSKFLVSSSERAQRLRQSSPIMAVLSEDQQERLILDEMEGAQ